MPADARPAGEATLRGELFEWCSAVLDAALLDANLEASDAVVEELTQVVEAHCKVLAAQPSPAPVAGEAETLRRDVFAEVYDGLRYVAALARGDVTSTESLDTIAHRLTDAIVKHASPAPVAPDLRALLAQCPNLRDTIDAATQVYCSRNYDDGNDCRTCLDDRRHWCGGCLARSLAWQLGGFGKPSDELLAALEGAHGR